MTTITATVIADSVSENGKRITTMQLRYPRWIHPEGRTHRLLKITEDEFDISDILSIEPRTPSLMEDPNLSRNASSNRAIPVSKLIQDVLDDPAIPMFWGANQKGMQAGAECNTPVRLLTPDQDSTKFTEDHNTLWDQFHRSDEWWAESDDDTLESQADGGETSFPLFPYDMDRDQAWLEARDRMIDVARAFDKAGYHKQIVNRLLEPFSHINVVVTATEWTNFFALRRHNDAEPHMHYLADRMWSAMEDSVPRSLKYGQWHLPYVTDDELATYGLAGATKMSVARCASVSYLTVDGKIMTPERALSLHDKLVAAHPIHASPTEHQGTPDIYQDMAGSWMQPHLHGNFVGWLQYRKTIPGEHIV